MVGNFFLQTLERLHTCVFIFPTAFLTIIDTCHLLVSIRFCSDLQPYELCVGKKGIFWVSWNRPREMEGLQCYLFVNETKLVHLSHSSNLPGALAFSMFLWQCFPVQSENSVDFLLCSSIFKIT